VKAVTVWYDYIKEADPSIRLPDTHRAETIWLVEERKKDK
jgi:hypothetical protein